MEEQAAQTQVIENEDEEAGGREKRRYKVGEFDGPLDLLWTLIRDNKFNIYDIPIAEITEQFLEPSIWATFRIFTSGRLGSFTSSRG